MSLRITRSRLSLVAAALVAMPLAAHGQAKKVPAECQPLIDAELKQVTTPNHMYVTSSGAAPGGQSRTAESITIGNVTYATAGGNKWLRSPVTPQELLKMKQENVGNYKKMTCKKLPDEAVNGAAANVYDTYLETEDGTVTGKIWIGRSLGVPLKSETDMNDGGGTGKVHASMRAEYTNVHAPAGM